MKNIDHLKKNNISYKKKIISIKYTNFVPKKKKLKIIEWYICRDREIENIFRNSSIFKKTKLVLVNFRKLIIRYTTLQSNYILPHIAWVYD